MKLIVSALSFGLAGLAFSQFPLDHPNLKGNNARTGVNGDTINSGPGYLQNRTAFQAGSLRWFRPYIATTPVGSLRLNEVNPITTVIDNTDFKANFAINLDGSGNNVGPYDPLPNEPLDPPLSQYKTFASSTGTWNTPTEVEEAKFPFTLQIRRNLNAANPIGFQGRDPNVRYPAHLWARTTSSQGGVGGDPRLAIVPANLNTFSWTFTPHLSTLIAGNYVTSYDPTPKGYALYVWIPQGMVTPGGTPVPRPRYWSYEITYGIGQKYVDIVDTEAAGGGWVRLGNGGRPTNQLFQYSGMNGAVPWPITIKLFNTISRDSQDQLTEIVNGGNPDNRFAVFADAAKFTTESDNYIATPTSAGFGGLGNIRVTGAVTERQIDPATMPAVGGSFTSKPLTVDNGVVRSYDYNTGNERWTYSPSETGPTTKEFDDTSVRVVPTGGFTSVVDNPNARGGAYLKTPVNTVATTENVTISPLTDLIDGSYRVLMYVGGDVVAPPVAYAKEAEYEIFEGGVSAGRFKIDMSGPPGWKQLGDRRFLHSNAIGQELTIRMENRSSLPADAGKSIYVDQFRFVGSEGTAISSTPVHARALVRLAPGAAPVDTNVVLIADERGRIHCVDANGNGDGTTTCYWTYPSLTDNVNDPNLQPGQDPNDPNTLGVFQKFDGEADTLQAQMPVDYDLSTAVVQRMTVTTPLGPTPLDYLIIGSKNGRVYSIAMEGRGDFAGGKGSTFRRWTYPETYPATIPKTSQLGSIASVISANLVIAGLPTDVVIVATEQGRIYCLDGQGDFTYSNGNQLKTNIIWQYPAANATTLPAISGAPTLDVANNRLFFGTKHEDDNPARFMALNATTGAPIWATPRNSIVDAYVDPNLTGPPSQLDWFSGSCYVPAATLNALPTASLTPMPDTIFAMNENHGVYAINAATGNVIWRTQELQSGGVGSLIYTEMRTFNNSLALGQYPVIMVPTEGGRFAALFARIGEETRFGNRMAWGYDVGSPVQASMSVSNKWLFGATTSGYLLAWSDLGNAGSNLGAGENGPGNDSIPDNDPNYDNYRNCEVAYLSRQGFVNLRRTLTGSITSLENSFAVFNNAAMYTKPYGKLIPPYRSTHGAAFEWGETIYLIAYNFPYTTQDTSGNDVSPPIVEATVTTEGRAGRPVVAEARVFRDKTSGDPDGGFAIFAIPLTAGGGTSHTPGPGTIRVQIRTSAVNGNNTQQSISLNPQLTQLDYKVANPIGLSIEQNYTAAGTSLEQLGNTTNPIREDALANGSQDLTVTGVGSVLGSRFGKSVGNVAHGGTKKTNVYPIDRSLVTLLRGEGRGLDLVKVDRKDLVWQGDASAVYKPFSLVPGIGALLGNFEDLPGNHPNTSLDYGDIQREQVKVRKDPFGNVENPVFNNVSIKGPVLPGGGAIDELNASTRLLVPTTFEFQVDVPKYQPVNIGNFSIPNQNGAFWQAGYAGRFTIYVDSDQSGSFGGGSREAYRTFNLAAAVSPDERIAIGTPNVDLGSLAAGAGYDARLTYSATFPYRALSASTFFNPYGPEYTKMFKPFTAFNEGNVNLWNVRVAKGTYDVGTALYWPWQVLSGGNNADIWIDAATDVHSNIDGRFAPEFAPGFNNVFAQKARVGDSIGHQIKVNPSARVNPNLPGSGFPLIAGNANLEPTISVTPPLGTPIGRYSQLMRLVEDTGGSGPVAGRSDESISIGYTSSSVIPQESFSDPTFTLTFNVKETQLTGGRSPYTAAGVHEGNAVDPAHPAQWATVQPSGMRTSDGHLLMAFASNQPSAYPIAGNTNPNNRNTRIFLSAAAGNVLGAPDARGQDSQIRDLNKFTPDDPANQRWFRSLGSLPNVPDATIFLPNLTQGVGAPFNIGGVLTGDVSYSNPVWSTNGDQDLGGVPVGQTYVAYTGTAKRQTNTGVVDDSRIIISEVTVGGIGNTHVLDADPFMLKGRPTMVQSGRNIYIFYPAMSNGVWSIYQVVYNLVTGWTIPKMLQFGTGFESVSNPAVVLRDVLLQGVASTEFNLTFTGRLRSSGVSEVFMARLDPNFNYRTVGQVNPVGSPVVPGSQIVENSVYDAKFGAFRVRGAVWNGQFDISSNGTSILTSVPTIDRQTKLQSATTIFGGRAVIDPDLGTIKITGAPLPKTAQLQVTYTPTFMRLSETGNAGYTSPSLVFDNRLENSNTTVNYAFWKTPSGLDEPGASANTFADRMVMSAVRSATAGGQTARPTMATYRLGVRLGRSILANPDGSLAETVTVTGNVGSYQIDPAAGRIYFTRFDEDRLIRIQLGGLGSVPPVNVTRPVTFVGETTENFITMENPVNESNLYMFLDPVGTISNRRGMIWMLWSSTRGGAPSIFMQSIARKILPVLPPN